ncbi:hypothetical protein HYN43_015135 [Mucilaginibacter celer]|uniref:Uncharacterized protein n=1 Tax=Mucilaginibacter celer TaxID=2305508 RepID=A0A494W000_9SPHI|nr:hypothetical protein HYN43_015135 [Mucilaginibacter celer]
MIFLYNIKHNSLLKSARKYMVNASVFSSHTIEGGSRCGKNIVQLWQEQVTKDSPFPEMYLTQSGKTLADMFA